MGPAEGALESALQRHELEYAISPGEGTFYGPKIDLHMTDVLGRSWQMGTIQLDYQMPVQFGLTYMGPTTASTRRSSSTVRCSARSSASSASSIEHYGGEFPFWLAPVQGAWSRWVRVTATAAARTPGAARAEGFRVEVDDRDETLGKRIRDAELEKVPFVVVYGDRESDARSPCASGVRAVDACLSTSCSGGFASSPPADGRRRQGTSSW